jgi:hypothetical protein
LDGIIIIEVEDRAFTKLELRRLAAALAVYRAEHGQYPDTLDELTPEIVPQLPLDLYSDQPFIYRRDADGQGYVLYSVYLNGVDDGGTDWRGEIVKEQWVDPPHVPVDQSDLVIRLPVPPLKLPRLNPAAGP